MTHGFHVAMIVCAVLAAGGGALAGFTIRDDVLTAGPERRGEPPVAVSTNYSCSVAGPPWLPASEDAEATEAVSG